MGARTPLTLRPASICHIGFEAGRVGEKPAADTSYRYEGHRCKHVFTAGHATLTMRHRKDPSYRRHPVRLKRDILDQAIACAAVTTPSGDTHRKPSAAASPTRKSSPRRRTATSRPARTVSGREAQSVWTRLPSCFEEETVPGRGRWSSSP